MSIKQEIHLDSGVLLLGPVQPAGDQRLKDLMEATVRELEALGQFSSVTLSAGQRTYQISASWGTELARNVFRWVTDATVERVEADPHIEWGGPG